MIQAPNSDQLVTVSHVAHTSQLFICLVFLPSFSCQAASERDAETRRLQEQLAEANEAIRANQSSQSIQASDANTASDANQARQEELTKLRQEVPQTLISCGGCVSSLLGSFLDNMIVMKSKTKRKEFFNV